MTRPTHRIKATGDLVFPNGYAPEGLELLPDSHWQDYDAEAAKQALIAYAWGKVTAVMEAVKVYSAGDVSIKSDCTNSTRSDWLQLVKWADRQDATPVQWLANDMSVTPLPFAAVQPIADQVGDRAVQVFAVSGQVMRGIARGEIISIAQIDEQDWPE